MRTNAFVALLLLATSADASPNELGIRVGGYGFRRAETAAYDLCPMHGFGIVGQRALTGPLFVEAGLDLYTSQQATRDTDLPIDRESGLFSSAIGARIELASWLRGYAQLGAGLELANVSVPYGDRTLRETKPLPEGFFGIGFDVKLGNATYLGSTFRSLVMGNFDYDPARLDPNNMWVAQPMAESVFAASPHLAAQVQFSVRREL